MQHLFDALKSNPFAPGCVVSTVALTTNQPRARIRRHSFLAGTERGFWRAMGWRELRMLRDIAEEYEENTSTNGARNGKLGHVALEILKKLASLIDYKTGRLDPSIATLMRLTRRSRGAVVRALSNLRDAGFLDWRRRYVPANDPDGRVQVQQTSNAYRFAIPAWAASRFEKLKPPPVPDDAAVAGLERETKLRDFSRALTDFEFVDDAFDDETPLSRALKNLAKARQDRESSEKTESEFNSS